MSTRITDYTKLAVQAITTAASLTKTMGIGPNGTQPAPAAGPSTPSLQSTALATLFSASLGDQTASKEVVGAIAGNLVNQAFSDEPGSIGGAIGALEQTKSAGQLLKSLEPGVIVSAKVAPEVLADVANSAFATGSEALDLAGAAGVALPSSLTLTASDGADQIPTDWVFVVAPQNITWEKRGEANTVNTYGSNNPYVVYSTTSMRSLRMTDVLVEGFSAGREVQTHIEKLEAMMTMVMNTQRGYVSPYCWDLKANDKSYGKFVITEISIDEVMRNEKGRADRARVSIMLQEVPDFQVNDGRDLSTRVDLASGNSLQSEVEKAKETSTKSSNKNSKEQAGKPLKPQTTKPLNIDNPQKPLNLDD